MNIEEAKQFIIAHNPIRYYKIQKYHREIMGFKKPCNIFELTYAMGSERKDDTRFEKVVFEKHGYGFLIRLKYLYKKSLNIFHNFV